MPRFSGSWMPMNLPAPFVAALTEPQILAVTLYGEARGEPIEGQIAVGCVIRNRVDVGKWGASYAKVCLAPWQFSCWKPEGGIANYETVMTIAETMAKGTFPHVPILRQCAWIAQGIIGQSILDRVSEATHYFSPAAMKPVGAVPKWATNKIPVAKVAGHLFFAGVA